MKIVSFCDFSGKSLDEQLNTAEKLEISNIILRDFEDKNIAVLTDNEIKNILKKIKTAKKNILVIDPLISSYNINDEEECNKKIFEYKHIITQSQKLKVNYIIYRFPEFQDILNDFGHLFKKISPIIDFAQKNGKTFYILKKLKKKKISLIFNPVQCVKNGEPAITAYRLFKNYFSFFVAADIDSLKNPELLGYGKVKIVELFKKMKRDNFNGFVILDESFPKFIKTQEIKKVPWYKKLLKTNVNKQNYLLGFSSRIFPNENGKIANIYDIYENQIKALKIIFNQED